MSYKGSTRLATPGRLLVGSAIVVAFGCGGESAAGDTGGGGNPPTDAIAAAAPSGDLQGAQPGQPLADPLRVVVTNGSTPISGKAVSWEITSGGGQVSPSSTTTDANGVASTTVTLPQTGALITITASASATSSPIAFTALVAQDNATVSIEGPPSNRFTPQAVGLKAGGTVTFEYPNDAQEHNVIPDDGRTIPEQAVVRNGPFSFEVQFTTPGQYFYHCSVHGSARSGMYGVIVVVP